MRGGDKCYLHGGNSPAAKTKAETMLALARIPAIEAIHKVLEVSERIIDQFMDDTCLTCGYPKGDVEEKEALIRALRTTAQTCASILDRTGMGPTAKLELVQSDGNLDTTAMTDLEKAEMVAIAAQYRELKERVRARLHQVAFGLPAPAPVQQPQGPFGN